MATKIKKCIYCFSEDVNDFEKREHVIPQSFGTFSSQTPTLHCVCDTCNSFFGKELDNHLARNTIEGIYRYRNGIFSSEDRMSPDLSFKLQDVGEYTGVLLAGVHSQKKGLREILSQFWVKNFETQEYEIFVGEDIKNIEISKSEYKDESGSHDFRLYAHTEERALLLKEKLKKIGINYREKETLRSPFDTDSREIEIDVLVEGEIGRKEKRAYSKILFNFVAYYLGEDEVLKEPWNPLRKFVRNNEGDISFKINNDPFWNGQETESLRFSSNSYNISIENTNDGLIGVLQFFNLATVHIKISDSYQIPNEKEVAVRFTPGEEPYIGHKFYR